MKAKKKSPAELYEAKQQLKKLKLLVRMIDGAKANNEMFDLYMEMNAKGNISRIDKILFATYTWDRLIEEYERELAATFQWLQFHGYEPAEQLLEDAKFPDPYRWRVPAWLRKPIIKFFKSLFKANGNKSKS